MIWLITDFKHLSQVRFFTWKNLKLIFISALRRAKTVKPSAKKCNVRKDNLPFVTIKASETQQLQKPANAVFFLSFQFTLLLLVLYSEDTAHNFSHQ